MHSNAPSKLARTSLPKHVGSASLQRDEANRSLTCLLSFRDSVTTPSSLVSVLDMEADWSPTARFDEHRLSKNTIDLVCALGEQRRPTASMSNFPTCARRDPRSK